MSSTTSFSNAERLSRSRRSRLESTGCRIVLPGPPLGNTAEHSHGLPGERVYCRPCQLVLSSRQLPTRRPPLPAPPAIAPGRLSAWQPRRRWRHYRRAPKRPVQHFEPVYESGIDKIARGVRKTADTELIANRHSVEQHGNPVAADAPYVDASAPKRLPAVSKSIPGAYRKASATELASS